MPMNSRLLRPRASGVHPEAAAWRSAVVANGGTVSASTMKAVSTFCADIDKAGIRGRFWRLNLFAGDSDASLNAVRTPLYRGPSRTGTQYGGTTDTNLNFVQGDYAETGASGGLKGNGSTKSLNTEFATNNLSEGNRHISAYEILKATTTFDKAIGSDGAVGGPNSFYLATWTPASTYSFAFGNAGSTIQSVNYSGGAHWIGVNGSTGGGVLYKNGSSNITGSLTAATPGSENLRVFAIGRGTTSADHSDARLGAYSIGVSMTAAEALSYYTALQAFQTALGRNV